MAHRAYLYSVNKPPLENVEGLAAPKSLSEWPSQVPFSYEVLMSADPQLCPSLLGDGLEDDDSDNPTKLWANYSSWELGFERMQKLLGILKALPRVPRVDDADKPSELTLEELHQRVEETEKFLLAVKGEYVVLETVEIDLLGYMPDLGADYLRDEAEGAAYGCTAAGKGIDALPADPELAATVLLNAVENKDYGPLRVFYRLRFDDHNNAKGSPLGLYWTDITYYSFLDTSSDAEEARTEEPEAAEVAEKAEKEESVATAEAEEAKAEDAEAAEVADEEEKAKTEDVETAEDE